jgi:L-threonylcarbamoyladenylate synthase
MLEQVKEAVQVLRNGGVVLYPTDTIWGIGCDACNEKAVERIFKIKQRADSKAMICLTDSEKRLGNYVEAVPDIAWNLIECADKPLTIIYPKGKNLAKNLFAEDGSVAIRVTKEKVSNALCYRLQKPIVSTSANVSGAKPPANFAEISDEIKNAVDYIVPLKQKENKKSAPSGIIKLELDGIFKIIR